MSLNSLPERVTVVEVGPRDGLQNEPSQIGTADKVRLIDLLTTAGLRAIEVTSFVNPRWVPQMADAAAVFGGITRVPGVRYTAIVPNLRGFERAKAAGVSEVAVFPASSETFSRRNLNQSIEESFVAVAQVCRAAFADGIPVRGYLSTAFGCPYEREVPLARVVELAGRLMDLGVFEVALCDTIGVAHPGQVARTVEQVAARVPREKLALHFHDTRGMGLVNVLVGLQLGVATFDASAGGLGGCPYAPGANGNLATEDLTYMLDGLGIEHGISLPALLRASRFIERKVGHALPSRYARAVAAMSSSRDLTVDQVAESPQVV